MVCEFAFKTDGTVNCPLYYSESHTCNTTPHHFPDKFSCGKAKQLALEKEDLNAKIDQEMLYTHTGCCH